MSQNDRYVYRTSEGGSYDSYNVIIFLNEYRHIINVKGISYNLTYLPETDTFVGAIGNSTNNICEMRFDENQRMIKIKEFTLSGATFFESIIPINDIMICTKMDKDGQEMSMYIYNKALNEMENGETISYNKFIRGGWTDAYANSIAGRDLPIISTDFSRIYSIVCANDGNSFAKTIIMQILLDKDIKNIIGVKYKNKVFYATKKQLTATVEDVRKDKTFIGFKGIPETGTMEV